MQRRRRTDALSVRAWVVPCTDNQVVATLRARTCARERVMCQYTAPLTRAMRPLLAAAWKLDLDHDHEAAMLRYGVEITLETAAGIYLHELEGLPPLAPMSPPWAVPRGGMITALDLEPGVLRRALRAMCGPPRRFARAVARMRFDPAALARQARQRPAEGAELAQALRRLGLEHPMMAGVWTTIRRLDGDAQRATVNGRAAARAQRRLLRALMLDPRRTVAWSEGRLKILMRDLAVAHRLVDVLRRTPPTRVVLHEVRRRLLHGRRLSLGDLRRWRHWDATRIARVLLGRRWHRRVRAQTFANLRTRAQRVNAIRERWHSFAEEQEEHISAVERGLLPAAYAHSARTSPGPKPPELKARPPGTRVLGASGGQAPPRTAP